MVCASISFGNPNDEILLMMKKVLPFIIPLPLFIHNCMKFGKV